MDQYLWEFVVITLFEFDLNDLLHNCTVIELQVSVFY